MMALTAARRLAQHDVGPVGLLTDDVVSVW
jgi:hypothetical protein